jgi:hypothetical protein
MNQSETKWAKGIYVASRQVNGKQVIETKLKVQEAIAFLLESQDAKGEVWLSSWPKKVDDGKGNLVTFINDWRPTPKAEAEVENLNPQPDDLPF